MKLTQDRLREIITDFAAEIQRKKRVVPSETTPIHFREGLEDGRQEPIYRYL